MKEAHVIYDKVLEKKVIGVLPLESYLKKKWRQIIKPLERKKKKHIFNTNDDEHMENLSFLLLVIGLE